MTEMKMVNIVAMAILSAPLDLEEMANMLPNSEQCKSAARWLKYRLGPENKYIAFYKSGKFLITGVRSREEVHLLVDKVVDELLRYGIEVTVTAVRVNNIVFEGKLDLPASLESIIRMLDTGKASYEPEQFPGLLYKDWGVSFLLFSSGKFIITGVRDEGDIGSVAAKFEEMIRDRS
jgi:transcription initiation factor TFIID TATA-box-binding protein